MSGNLTRARGPVLILSSLAGLLVHGEAQSIGMVTEGFPDAAVTVFDADTVLGTVDLPSTGRSIAPSRPI